MTDYYGWEIWFAWFPIKTEKGEWVWLENVGRKFFYINFGFRRYYIYRRIDRQPKNINFAI